MIASLKILGIPGSLRRNSYNRAALKAAQQLLPAGVNLDICDLAEIPLFNQDQESRLAPAVIQFKKNIRESDAILFATPEYNYSVPGVLKNAIDYASRPYGESAWSGKPVAVMGASPSLFGTARAQYHLRQMFVTLNMFPVNKPEVMISGADKAFDNEGGFADEKTRKVVSELLAALVQWTCQLQAQT